MNFKYKKWVIGAFNIGQAKIMAITLALNLANALPAKAASKDINLPLKEWTFLVFMNGNNDLDRYGYLNMNQMEKIGSTDKVNVVVQWASLSREETGRYYITKDNDDLKVTSPRLQNLGKTDMGDYRELIEFVRWGAQNFPAKKYFINVWDHGSGWHFIRTAPTRDISHDFNTGNQITTEQLALAMNESAKIIGHKIDLYGSDACLMGMVEVANELKDAVSVFLGSEDNEPGEGWPYDTFLEGWNQLSQDAGPREVSEVLIREYQKYYQLKNRRVTLSAFDMNFLEPLKQSLLQFSNNVLLLDSEGAMKLKIAALLSTNFGHFEYVDLGDFMRLVQEKNISPMMNKVAQEVETQNRKFVFVNGTVGYPEVQGSTIWIPKLLSTYQSYDIRYSRLNFDQETHWGEVVKAIVNAKINATGLK